MNDKIKNTTMTFDELVILMNEEYETNYDAGDFNLSSIHKISDNLYSFDNGYTNVEFEIDEDNVKELYKTEIKIIDFYDV